jgi:hypothetical protein
LFRGYEAIVQQTGPEAPPTCDEATIVLYVVSGPIDYGRLSVQQVDKLSLRRPQELRTINAHCMLIMAAVFPNGWPSTDENGDCVRSMHEGVQLLLILRVASCPC